MLRIACAERLSQIEAVAAIHVLLLVRAAEELVALHGRQRIDLADALQLRSLAHDTLKFDLFALLRIYLFAVLATFSLPLDIEPCFNALSLVFLLLDALLNVFLHEVDVFEDFLLALVASQVH